MLDIRGLRSGYRNYEVLQDIDLTVAEGEIVCLLGHNGAGKSTLLKAIFGLLPVTGGEVNVAGRDMTHARAFDKVAMGLRFVPQEGNVFPNLPVEDNLRLGAVKGAGGPAAVARNIREVYGMFPILQERRDQPARVLSGGERQMLAVSIALMTEPKVLLLDEPSAGLAPIIVAQLFERVRLLRDQMGKTVLLVEQNVTEALKISNRTCILEEGRVVYTGPSTEKDAIVRKLWRLD